MDLNCYQVLHDGEGPIGRHCLITNAKSPDEAAERMAEKLWSLNQSQFNVDPDDGEYQWIAVQQANAERFQVFKVINRIKRELHTHPHGSFTRDQIALGKITSAEPQSVTE